MESIPILLSVKRFLRILIAHFLYYTGVLNLLINRKLKNKAVVLMYHRVLDKEEISSSYSQNCIIVSKKSFAAQMKYLQSHLNAISLDDTIHSLKNKTPFPPKCCLVTFDDGWKDNYQNAYSILRKHKIPATIFLPTDYIGTNKHFWQERLNKSLIRLYQHCTKDISYRNKALKRFQNDELSKILYSNQNDVKENIASFISKNKKQGQAKVDAVMQQIEDFSEVSSANEDQDRDFMSWEEIKEMAGDGIKFGSHGKSHTILTEAIVDLHQELSASKSTIESHLSLTIKSFSYPNGDYTNKITGQARQHGYEIAFGTEPGFITREDNPYTLKRINIHEDMTNSMPMFVARIAGL